MKKVREVLLELQPYINSAPISHGDAHNQACTNDNATIDRWSQQWLSQIRSNHASYGPFSKRSVGSLYGEIQGSPTVIVGSGPSLKENAHLLVEKPENIRIISCLHNFHYLEDLGVDVDYYVTLDAGELTIDEISEGGLKSEDEYFELTKDKKLLAFIGTHPKLLEKWQGEIYFFNAPVPDEAYTKKVDEIEPFHIYVESGGNVLGASLMLAKGILGSQISIFIGADFAFSDSEKTSFHAWDSKYDKDLGHYIMVPSIFGHRIRTWQSYYNFKLWFDVVAQRIPGIYINATENGCLGAYREGNLCHIRQMTLKECLDMFSIHTIKKSACLDPSNDRRIILI